MTEDYSVSSSQFPVLQLWDSILAVPIVGSMDSSRTKELMQTLLNRTRETAARVVIIDLSGVAVMDTEVSKRLLDLQEAVRLMGGEYMVSGIQPDQTNSLVELGIDLGNVETHHDLSSALSSALESIGLEIDNKEDVLA